ncbi:unnamed protein product [Allacma fusca]|uniref:Peptidase M12A domain-containing protein n=1 Tax=Allacma fusca TaxID=39272 RepID=A0A8J2NM35_9HEXA|nr:unnamed protein product [Allacma fusca]
MAKIISYLALIVVVLIYMADCRICKNVGEECGSNNDCTSGNCQERRCEEKVDTRKNTLRGSHQLLLNDIKPNPDVNTRSGVLSEGHWPNATVPYELDPDFTLEQKEMILETFYTIESYTCVTFVERSNEEDYVIVMLGETGDCDSYVGKIGGAQTLTLSVNLTEDGWTCLQDKIIMQETLHTLGFEHEHNRYDRDDYITLNWDNIACDSRRNFEKREYNSTTFDLPYDYVSVLHYSNNEGGIDPDVPVLIPKPNYGFQIGNEELSELDVLKINRMYNCSSPYS